MRVQALSAQLNQYPSGQDREGGGETTEKEEVLKRKRKD